MDMKNDDKIEVYCECCEQLYWVKIEDLKNNDCVYFCDVCTVELDKFRHTEGKGL